MRWNPYQSSLYHSACALAEAEACYTGEVLEGEALQGEQFAEQAALREECRAVHLAVLRRLVEGHAGAGNTDEALRHGLRLLRVDPYDEPTHLVLVVGSTPRDGTAKRCATTGSTPPACVTWALNRPDFPARPARRRHHDRASPQAGACCRQNEGRPG